MGLLSIIRKLKQKERETRILILGLDNAGKTTVVAKLSGGDTSLISPTLGFNISTLVYKSYKLNLWDIGGQKSIRSYWRNYFESTDGLIFVIDSGDRMDRLQDARDELFKLLQEERLAGASLLVFCNKQDLPSARPVKLISQILELDKIASHHVEIFGCSGMTGLNLLEGINWIVDDIASRIYVLD